MEEELISLETAKLAKEKGFNGLVLAYHNPIYGIVKIQGGSCDMNAKPWGIDYFSLPTQSLLKKWLRDEHSISIKVDDFTTDSKIRYDYSISKLGSQDDNPQGIFVSYEAALEEGLQEALKLI